MNYTRIENQYGSEEWQFNVVGVTFKNDDGSDRQEIISHLYSGIEYNCGLDRYDYQGKPAYHVRINSKIVGNIPKNIAAEFAKHDDDDFWICITKAGVHGGPKIFYDIDDDDAEDEDGWYGEESLDRPYGIHLTVKLISPAEREAKNIYVDNDGTLHEDTSEPEDAPEPIEAQESPVSSVEDAKHRNSSIEIAYRVRNVAVAVIFSIWILDILVKILQRL